MIDIKILMPKGAIFNPEKLAKIVENTLNEAADGIQNDLLKPTGNWEHKPTFTIDSEPGKRTIYTKSEIYAWVSGGTEGHYIAPRGAKPGRFFRTGFRPKSRVNSLASNKGKKATKDLSFYSAAFWHPGSAARNFDLTVQKKWKKEFKKQMQQAIDTAFQG